MSKRSLPAFLLMMFFSGFSGLVYQVLWMKQLGLLFGNTAQAASITLAVFFAGLAAGSAFWGERSSKTTNPLRLYAWLEVGIAVTALVYFGLIAIFNGIYPSLYRADVGDLTMTLVKCGLAALLIFPPAFCMGGTLPAMGQHLIRNMSTFGRTAAAMYSVNTLGAAAGVCSAAFLLVPWYGFRISYAVAVGLSAAIAAITWWLSRHAPEVAMSEVDQSKETKKATPNNRVPSASWPVMALSFVSGFSVLALEVLWTRMYAQVHENSVYAFAMILVVVLVCLALGAWISSRLARFNWPAMRVLGVLVTLGGLVMAFGPSIFMKATDGMQSVSSLESWSLHVLRIFKMGFGGIGLVATVLGIVFPFLMKAAEQSLASPGRMLGRLLAWNTCGAILGALVCGFILLPLSGMWGSMRWIAALYLVIGLLFPYGPGHTAFASRLIAALCLLVLFSNLNPTQYSPVKIDPRHKDERVLESWEGRDCTVTAVETKSGTRLIRVNSSYILGSTGAFYNQQKQGSIPLLLYPEAKDLFFLGMGTGMSAGASLNESFPNVESVTTCELVPEVVEASKKYMPENLLGGLFNDPRSTVLVEDGRHYLMATDKTYDIINADLFLPYRRGAGSLYSLEHFLTAKKRLNPGGSYVQWLPLYQLTDYEFGVITRTMLEAFDQVSMWRNNFDPGYEVVALIGQNQVVPIATATAATAEELIKAVDGLMLTNVDSSMAMPEPEALPFFYAGNLTAARDWFDAYPINTDDMPVIEYQTPRTFRDAKKEDDIIWFVGPRIADLTERLLDNCPPDEDPMLQNRTLANRHFAYAGLAFHRAMVAKARGQKASAEEQWQKFKQEWRASADTP